MIWQSNPYVYLMLFAGAISLSVASFIWRRCFASGSLPLAVVNIGGGIWAGFTALQMASATLGAAVIFHKLSYFGMDLIGIAWFAFAAQYTGHERWVTPKKLVAVAIVPFTTQILVWTSPYQTILWKALAFGTTGSFAVLRETPGLWWWIDSIYNYGLLGIGVIMFFFLFVREPGVYRRQVSAVLAAVLVPLAVDSIYTWGLPRAEPVDLAPICFVWVGLVLYWGFARYQLLDVTPVAREFVVRHLGDSLLVTDTRDRVVHINPAAEKLLGKELRSVAGRPIAEVMAGSAGLMGALGKQEGFSAESSQEWEHAGRFYDGRVSILCDRRDRVRGSILVLRDITDRKVAELALDEARQELEHRVEARTAELADEKEQLARLNAVAVEIARCATSFDVLRAGARLACSAVGCGAAALWASSSRGAPRLFATEGLPGDERRLLRRLMTTSSATEEAMSKGMSAFAELEDSEEERGLSALLFRKVAIVPLISGQRNLGALCLLSGDDCAYPNEIMALARGVASQLAVALENAHRYDDARFLAERDSLTRLLNHRGISKRLEQQMAHSGRSGSVFALVTIDVDNFKLFNDAYGHAVGDQVLQRVASSLTASLRKSDVIGRIGGDEFMAVLPDSDAHSAFTLIERFRVFLAEQSFRVESGENVPITMSYGVAGYPVDGTTVSELLAAADANLYRSKQKGGDYVTVSGSDEKRWPMPLGSFTVLDGLVTTIDSKDHYTRRHSDDVTEYALAVASKLGLSLESQRSLRIAGLLHDVGRLGVPDQILRKPAGLTAKEFEAIKQHVTLGELIIKGIPDLKDVLGAVAAHHERLDGKGYPRGLKGEEIPLLGRILAVTDAYSAMTSDRPYRKGLASEEAKAELRRVSGTQLDPPVVEAFLEFLEKDELHEQTRAALIAST